MTTPTVVFWDGSPLAKASSVLGMLKSDMSDDLIERFSKAQSTADYRVLATGAGCNNCAPQAFDEVNGSSDTFHMAYFRGDVQVSFGERGFVPLARLLDYDEDELITYMSTQRRIRLHTQPHPPFLGKGVDLVH